MKESICLLQCKINNLTYRSKQQSSRSSSCIKRTQSTRYSPWKQLKTPSFQTKCRSFHASILHKNNLFIYGGFDNDFGILDDFKMFQIINDQIQTQNKQKGKWISLPIAGGPGPRHSHTAIFHGGYIYIFGGKVDRIKNSNTLYSYSIQEKRWQLIETFDSEQQKFKTKLNSQDKQNVLTTSSCLILKNKQNNKQNIKTLQKLTQLYKNKPEGVDSHQAVILGDQMIIYGGFSNNKFTNNIHTLNLKTRIWKKIFCDQSSISGRQHNFSQCPQPRGDFSMVEYKNKLYIYGGKNINKSFNDFWQFNLHTLKFRKLDQKIPTINLENRSGHSAIIYGDCMLIFGGIQSVTHQRDDLICYQFLTERWFIIWKNSSLKPNLSANKLNKNKSKKISNSKCKVLQKNFDQDENQDKDKHQKTAKYRRPIAQEKKNKNKKEQKIQKQRNKKQNQRKINLLNQIETAIKPYQHMQCQQYSPLIQSLNNSIIMTSNSHNNKKSTDTNFLRTSSSYGGSGKEQKILRGLQTQKQYYKQKKLKPRDGHTAHLYNSYMIIFGGDRHKIALNDLVFINIPINLQNKLHLPLNQSQLSPLLLNNQKLKLSSRNQLL